MIQDCLGGSNVITRFQTWKRLKRRSEFRRMRSCRLNTIMTLKTRGRQGLPAVSRSGKTQGNRFLLNLPVKHKLQNSGHRMQRTDSFGRDLIFAERLKAGGDKEDRG